MISSPQQKNSGRSYEKQACIHLAQQGHNIIYQNFTINTIDFKGEIDIISQKNNTIFVNEVKKRSSFAENCISQKQIERIWFAYHLFLEKYKQYQNISAQMQLILIANNNIDILDII